MEPSTACLPCVRRDPVGGKDGRKVNYTVIMLSTFLEEMINESTVYISW